MGSTTVAGTESSNIINEDYIGGQAPSTSSAESGNTGTTGQQVGEIISSAKNGSGPFADVEGFDSGLTADEQELLNQAETLRANGHEEAALYLEIKAAQSIDARFSEATGGEVQDVNRGLTIDGQDLTAFLADAETGAKTDFFESLPQIAESMGGEEFFLFVANVAYVVGPDSGLLDADAFAQLEGYVAAYNYNTEVGNSDEATLSLLSIGFLLKSEMPGIAPADNSVGAGELSLAEKLDYTFTASFDSLIIENARMAKVFVKEELSKIITSMSGSENNDQIETLLMENARLNERINDLYSIWQTAFQMAAR